MTSLGLRVTPRATGLWSLLSSCLNQDCQERLSILIASPSRGCVIISLDIKGSPQKTPGYPRQRPRLVVISTFPQISVRDDQKLTQAPSMDSCRVGTIINLNTGIPTA